MDARHQPPNPNPDRRFDADVWFVREPSWCPHCCDTRGLLTFDPETFTFACAKCGHTWCATPERRR